jgi:uncharacterized membrane protein (DUF485 family)
MRTPHPDLHYLSPEEHARLARHVMHEQAALSLKVAAVFVVLVFGLPLVNNFLPELANTRVLGFTATWLFLGVLFFPITWALSAYFIRESNRIEAECADWRSFLGLTSEGMDEVRPAFAEEDAQA